MPEWVGDDHCIIFLNETWEPVDVFRYWEGDNLYYYHNFTDGGRIYVIELPHELMECDYNGQKFIPQYTTKLYAYMMVNSVPRPIPAPGEPLNGWWELDWVIKNRYSFEIAYINGTAYPAQYDRHDSWPGPPFSYDYPVYRVNVLGTLYNLTDWGVAPDHLMDYNQFPDTLPWISKANGSIFIPEIIPHGWTVAAGNISLSTLEFNRTAWLDLETGFFDGNYDTSRIWEDNGTHRFVRTLQGEEFLYNETWRALFHKITLANGTIFYSGMEHPFFEPTDKFSEHIDKFYMIDIYGTFYNWTGWMEFTSEVVVVYNVTGYPSDGSFWFLGQDINVTQFMVPSYWWDGFEWRDYPPNPWDNVRVQQYHFLQAMNGSRYEVVPLFYTPESYRYNFPASQFLNMGIWYNITGRSDMIYKAYTFEGYSKKLDYAPLPVSIVRSQYSIISGAPRWGMWDVELWLMNPLTGAIDLDGNLETTYDQYFIKEYHTSTDFYNITHEYLDVTIFWEPNNNTWADEFYLHSFTGMVTFNWTFSWADTYIWTKADTGATLTPEEFASVNRILFDAWGNPKPGYWNIAWMAENFTSADLLQRAIDEGWDWVPEGSQEWTWLWWELEESYNTPANNGTDLLDINLAYQYAGMFAWNDTDSDNFMDISSESLGDAELSHYWMPIDVLSVNFTTPGEAWGNYNANDTVYRSVNETIDFGVTFINVTGEVFPFGDWSYFDWYDGQYYGSDFSSFDERPTQCLTEEFTIDVHFTGELNETVNIAGVKFDIGVGDWDMYTPGGVNVLEGRSLAVSFFSDLTILNSTGDSVSATYLDDYNRPVTNNLAAPSSNFTMTGGLSNVALMSLGGTPYDWSKNTSYPTFVDAQTVPLDAFSAIYVSGGGKSATTFSIASTQFFTVIGFPQWDGYAVVVDPIFVGYISHGTTDTTAPEFASITAAHYPDALGDYVRIQAHVIDAGGSDIASVKVHDIDSGQNHTMTFNEVLERWIVDIHRTEDASYTFNYQIIAKDNAGNVGVSTPRVFIFRDNIDPTIDTLSIVNGTGIYGEIATITVIVSDTGGSGISNVVLTYSNSSGTYNVPMSFSAGEWTGIIPTHAPTTIVPYYVTAWDIDGNFAQSTPAQFIFASGGTADTFGPSIAFVDRNPISPTSSDSVTVSSDILDISGVSSATLQYRIDSGAWNNVTMTNVGDTWSGIIPAQADGVTVTYRIVAYDGIGNEAISEEDFYIVSDSPVTPTTTTTPEPTPTPTPTGPSPEDRETMLMVYGAFGTLVVLVLILGVRRRR